MENEEHILREFANCKAERGSLYSAISNKNDPIYDELSQRLNLSKKKIYEVILKRQPRVLMKQYR